MNKKYAFYCSGNAGRLIRFYEKQSKLKYKPEFILYDGGKTEIFNKLNHLFPYKVFTEHISVVFSEHLLGLLESHKIDYLFCFGNNILKGKLLHKYVNKIINFHPSILPSFPGLNAIDQALHSSVQVLGNTAHFIDEGIDTGLIIMQSVISRTSYRDYEDVLILQLDMLQKIWEFLENDQIEIVDGCLFIKEHPNMNNFFFYLMISVVMITYSQELYILAAIEAVLMQICNCNVELIIANDNSPDNSDNIINRYLAEVTIPSNFSIKYTKHEINKGMQENFIWAFQQATGKYIALCEGDDYWTDPLKLQKQVDFLEANPEYVICFHDVKILKPDGELVDDFITKVPPAYEDRLTLASNANYIHTPSVVFRNCIQKEINSFEFAASPIGDYFLYMILTKYGKIGYITEDMAVYRFGVGVYSAASSIKKSNAELLLYANLFSLEDDPEIKKIFYNNFIQYIKHSENEMLKLLYKNKLLYTRRHQLIEKIYKMFK